MDLFDLVAKITLDSSEYEKGIKGAEEGTSVLSSKWSAFGKVAGVAGAAAVAAIGAAAVGVGKLTKKSIEAYANYEQLAGGVKKLYGDASDEVMKFANQAYKTSGMSANQYMEQATSFSAALINSLNGDASAAAKQTDVAMRAISDNFNTFGGDIQNVQNAFQGFAKQNYSMLDNLKLGYGGTKGEMARLVDDANEYAKSIGMAGDLSMDSFSDIVTAIDLIQQKQGIAGTTAKEAATTIEGSLNMTKAAWENLVASFADPDADLGTAMDNLVVAIVGEGEGEGLLNNIIPAIERAIEGIAQVIQASAPILAEQFPKIIQAILPSLLQAATTLIAGLVQALPSLISVLVQQAPMIIGMLVDALLNLGNELVTTGATLIEDLTSGISAQFSRLLKKLISIAKQIPVSIKRGVGNLAAVGLNFISNLWSGIQNRFSSVVSGVKSFASKIPSAIKSGVGSLLSIGHNMIEGLWNGIKSKFDSVISRVKSLASGLPAAVKKVLGIASPSKVFMEVGKWIPEGLALGIEKNINVVYDASNMMADASLFEPSFEPSAGEYGYSGGSGVSYEFNIYAAPSQSAREIAEEVRRLIIKDESRRRVAWV